MFVTLYILFQTERDKGFTLGTKTGTKELQIEISGKTFVWRWTGSKAQELNANLFLRLLQNNIFQI